jgi:hypothetical protein
MTAHQNKQEEFFASLAARTLYEARRLLFYLQPSAERADSFHGEMASVYAWPAWSENNRDQYSLEITFVTHVQVPVDWTRLSLKLQPEVGGLGEVSWTKSGQCRIDGLIVGMPISFWPDQVIIVPLPDPGDRDRPLESDDRTSQLVPPIRAEVVQAFRPETVPATSVELRSVQCSWQAVARNEPFRLTPIWQRPPAPRDYLRAGDAIEEEPVLDTIPVDSLSDSELRSVEIDLRPTLGSESYPQVLRSGSICLTSDGRVVVTVSIKRDYFQSVNQISVSAVTSEKEIIPPVSPRPLQSGEKVLLEFVIPPYALEAWCNAPSFAVKVADNEEQP